MFDTHTLVIVANKVSHWDDDVDSLYVRWDGDTVNVAEDEWETKVDGRKVEVERTDEWNSIKVKVSGLVKLKVRVRPTGKEENRIHNYQLPEDDAFAHLETQFKFSNLSDLVEEIIGKTYRPDYVSPAKRGVAKPMVGGEDIYRTLSLFSPLCRVCRFQRSSENVIIASI